MIISVERMNDTSTRVRITMDDGDVWEDDTSLPADTAIRTELRAWLDAGGVIAPYAPPPPPVPESISRHQTAMQLLADNMITGPEALAMSTTSTPPAMIETTFAAMPEPEQTMARIRFASEQYRRDDVLLNAVMSATGATPEMIDQFFREAAIR